TSDAGMKRAQSLLDSNRAELNQLKTKLGTFELDRLNETENAIAALARRLQDSNMPIEGCLEYDRSAYAGALTKNMTTINALQCETIAMAFKCNLTKVASLQLSDSQANHVVPELYADKTYHNSIHGGASLEGLYAQMRAHLTEQLAELIRVLKETKDGNGVSLLETTLILQVTDMGDGGAHDNNNCPFTLATSNPNIVTGRVYSGTNNDKLLNTVSYALGVQDQVTNFGDVGHDTGIIT
ncbi:MAG: DUF1552 domain-containing protein, partial [Saccharospirillaceae bacterium]|nr:DUF1552 domain-containing protein [Pseudomonadales bacterium]NRB80699.1 DUF1552 domain-containing protein [Saccharospirillaceae bacterium]